MIWNLQLLIRNVFLIWEKIVWSPGYVQKLIPLLGGANGVDNQLAKINNRMDMNTDTKTPPQTPIVMETLVEEVRRITEVIDDQNKSDEIEGEWQTLAKVFDRLFFVAFFWVFLISSLVILMPIYAKHS